MVHTRKIAHPSADSGPPAPVTRPGRWAALWKLVKRDKYLLLIFLPIFCYYVIFCYLPMPGAIIAFKNYIPGAGMLNGQWVGLKWFAQFFQSVYFWRLIRNTFLLAFYPLVFGFPIPILFAICITEVKNMLFRRFTQTLSYFPYFISTVVVVGMFANFLSLNDGIINTLLSALGGSRVNFMMDPRWFRGIYSFTVIWQNYGFSSIIYIAAITGTDPQLFDAARVDGARKFQEIWHITLPSILPTIVVLLLLNVGGIMSVGFERVFLMYNPATYSSADVISTYVYRQGIESTNYSYATAVGLFNSVINFAAVYLCNVLSRRTSELSLW